jgi:hypothetical protein
MYKLYNIDEEKIITKIHQQILNLILSAKIILSIRKKMLEDLIEYSGFESFKELKRSDNNEIHPVIVRELKYYVDHIYLPFQKFNLCNELIDCLTNRNPTSPDENIALLKKKALETRHVDDLGLLRIFEKLYNIQESSETKIKELSNLSSNYDQKVIQTVIDNAKSINITGELITNNLNRIEKLEKFEENINEIINSYGGISSDLECNNEVIEKGIELDMNRHPCVIRAETMSKLSKSTLHVAIISNSIQKGNFYTVTTETMKIKYHFLILESFRKKYSLENYPRLRSSSEYSFRMSVESNELKKNYLIHTNFNIPTSLTKLPPSLSTLAVWLFSHCIRGIESQNFTDTELLLRNLLKLGRTCVAIRDEILIQIIKQLNNNPDLERIDRLWRVLGACLSHFPPSLLFESYLELYLFDEALKTPAALQCIRFLHEIIIKYGYDIVIDDSTSDLSLEKINLWLLPSLEGGYSSSLFLNDNKHKAIMEMRDHEKLVAKVSSDPTQEYKQQKNHAKDNSIQKNDYNNGDDDEDTHDFSKESKDDNKEDEIHDNLFPSYYKHSNFNYNPIKEREVNHRDSVFDLVNGRLNIPAKPLPNNINDTNTDISIDSTDSLIDSDLNINLDGFILKCRK